MKFNSKVTDIHFFTESVFYIRFERKGLQFKAGQYLVLSIPGIPESREYSIASWWKMIHGLKCWSKKLKAATFQNN